VASQRERAAGEIFHAAIVRKGVARENFLNATCQFDPSLRADVDLLIAAHEAATESSGELPNPEWSRSYGNADAFPSESSGTLAEPARDATAVAVLESPAVEPPTRTSPAAAITPSSAGSSSHHSLVMTIAWMVIGFAVLVIAAIGLVIWLRG
jgi:hypothetical protein